MVGMMPNETPWDQGNPMVGMYPVPHRLIVADIPGEYRAMVTWRVGTATLSCQLTKEELRGYWQALKGHEGTMTDSGLIVPAKTIVLGGEIPKNGGRPIKDDPQA
jgi:hypothetical protein